MRPPALDAARSLVHERFPDAEQAWLAGSVSRGEATATSDLDITVLLDRDAIGRAGGVHRETLDHEGWPVELFVHTAASIAHYVTKDLHRRHPTMARLVATGVPLLGDDAGAGVRRACQEALDRGPGAVADEELQLLRYGLTDLLDDLADPRSEPEAAAVVVGVWRATAELALAAAGAWCGTGKWLVRELQVLDGRRGTTLADDLDDALRRALAGDRERLTEVADGVLRRCGGRCRAGLVLAGESGESGALDDQP